jgi:L-seryl-tRNA(Ser) seleniumtransferase
MAAAEIETLRARAERLAEVLGWGDCIRETEATIGGGSLPGDTMPSIALCVPTDQPSRTARALRLGEPPLVGRIHEGALLIDLRTILPEHEEQLRTALRTVR